MPAATAAITPFSTREEDFVSRVKTITQGRGVDVVYDSVGQSTFTKSLDCLRPMGMMVSFGQASGSVPPFDLGILAAKGSLFLTRPSLMTYTAKREDLLAHASDLFDVVEKGAVKIEIRSDVSTGRGCTGPPGHGRPKDHGVHYPDSLIG